MVILTLQYTTNTLYYSLFLSWRELSLKLNQLLIQAGFFTFSGVSAFSSITIGEGSAGSTAGGACGELDGNLGGGEFDGDLGGGEFDGDLGGGELNGDLGGGELDGDLGGGELDGDLGGGGTFGN